MHKLVPFSNRFAYTITSSPLFCAGLCLTGLSLHLLPGTPAHALTVSNSAIFSPVLQVDGAVEDTGLAITGLGVSVTNISLSVSLTKCGATINPDGTCVRNTPPAPPEFSFNEDIGLYLLSPSGTTAALVLPSTLSGQDDGATVTWNFDDSFSSVVGGSSLLSGDYRPVDLFSIFDGQNPNGTWTLRYLDTTPLAPLSINRWFIAVTDNSPPGPGPGPADVPGPLPLAGLAAAFGWSRLLRKRIRAKRDLGAGS